MRSSVRSPLNMTETSAQPQLAVMRNRVRIFFGVLSSAVILAGGCAAQKRPTIPWSTAVLVREVPLPAAPLATRTPPAPARPHSVAPPANPNARTEKPEAPQIVPELSTQESTALQRETEQSLTTAERNLAATAGKPLNATQSDLASKVRSFISDAREAGRAGDWARARDLAKKAQVLSEELVGSQ
jgi:hypothetical protein